MTIEAIRAAVEQARRFAREGDALIQALKLHNSLLYGSKQTGQLRRHSMDLTRALSEMRKP